MKSWSSISRQWGCAAVLVVVVFASGCTIMAPPRLQPVHSNLFVTQKKDVAVGLIVPASTRAFSTARITGICKNGYSFLPSPYGENFVNSLRDRLSQIYRTVTNVTSERGVSPEVILEATFTDLDYKFGCAFSPEGYVEITASLRATDRNGREIWQNSQRTFRYPWTEMWLQGRNSRPGIDISKAIATMVDGWVQELLQISDQAFGIEPPKLRARLEKAVSRKAQRPNSKPKPSPPIKTGTSGSGFFVSKLGHVITNQHVVSNCKEVTVGDNAQNQVTADVLETDRRNDLALLKISSLKMASVETKSLIQKLGISIVPLASGGLFRSEGVELGERVLVAGYPYGEIFSNSIKVTGGMVSANRGLGDDTGQFQMDAAVQPGSSGGPIYDENGNIVGVVVAQLNKMKFAKNTGSMPENVNFGIKASTVRQFLTASGLPSKLSERSQSLSTKVLAKIAKRQTVMVVCHR